MKVLRSSQDLVRLDVTNSVGNIIVVGPSDCREYIAGGVILLTHVIDDMVVGLRMDHIIDGVDLWSIMKNLGFSGVSGLVYFGGMNGSMRLHLIHSLDWESSSTVRVCDDVGVTSDVSILRAISDGVGPRKFRACAGHWKWDFEYLNDQLSGCMVSEDGVERFSRWGCIEGDSDLIFNYSGRNQMRRALNGIISSCVNRVFK